MGIDLPRVMRDGRGRRRLPSVRMIGRNLLPAFPGHLGGGLPPGVAQLKGNRHIGPAADAVQNVLHGRFALV
ncbi:MAG TPA: hypothetical protein VE420_05170 [Gemmatimonadales bacterium]|nr:hypothetical protein [Gemmatimonadales bacterium]